MSKKVSFYMLNMYQQFQYLKRLSYCILQKFQFAAYSKYPCKIESNIFQGLKNSSKLRLINENEFFSAQNSECSKKLYSTINQKNENPKCKEISPLDTSVIIFPGQGIIKVGDIESYLKFPKVKELFEVANEILGYNLLKVCTKGPQEVLDRTEFNQPATVVFSLAALEKLQEERPRAIESCIAAVGYSVGEITALIFSGAINYEEGLKLVGIRAAAMQSASELSSQGMLSCYCLPSAHISRICRDAEKWAMDIGVSQPICRIAIYLCTQGKVFGGSNEALQYIERNCYDLSLRKVKRLPVSGAFHTMLMEPALKSFIKALNIISIHEPNVLVYSNYSTKTYNNDEKLSKKLLSKQIISPIRWEQIMHKIYKRQPGTEFPRTFDVGSGGMMKNILKMINAKAAENCYIY